MGLEKGLKWSLAEETRVRTLNDQIPVFLCPLLPIFTIGGGSGKMPVLLYAQKVSTSHNKRGSVSLEGALSPQKKWDA